MSVVVGRKKKVIAAIAISIVVLLAVGLGLVFGLKGSEFAWALENLEKTVVDSNAVVELNDESKQLTIKDLKEGDNFSFQVKLQNPTADRYNYRLTLTTEKNTMVSSQLGISVMHNQQEKDVYGATSKQLEAAAIDAGRNETITVTITAGADLVGLGDSVLKVDLKAISERADKTGSLSSEYALVTESEYLEDGFTAGGNVFLAGKPTEQGATTYDFANDLVLESGKTLAILGEEGNTPIINLAEKTIVVEAGAKLELQNVILKGHIITKTQDGVNQAQAARAVSTVSNLVLNNVTIYGSEERINEAGTLDTRNTYNNDTKPAVIIEEDTKLQIVGDVKIVGNWDASGIGVHEDVKVEITGDNLIAIGNGGKEVMPTGNEYYKSKEQAQALSADSDFSAQLVNDYTEQQNPDAFVTMRTEGTDETVNKFAVGGGSGIGGIYGNKGDATGEIYIHDLKSLIAEGYGRHAFGIGGNVSRDIVIERSTINKVRGGFAVYDITDYDSYYYGSGVTAGGAAIGTINQQFNGTMSSLNAAIPNVAGVALNEVIINSAYGGHKSAAIGAAFWSPAKVMIANSKLNNVWGGTFGAGIGGARIGDDENQELYIEISNSDIDAHGGAYAAGIGTGSCDTVRRVDRAWSENRNGSPFIFPQLSLATINIKGDCDIDAVGGIGGAGIGTGLNVGRVEGTIEASVDVEDVKAGGFGKIVAIRPADKKIDGKYVCTFKFGEFYGSGMAYYYALAESLDDVASLTLEDFVKRELNLSKPQDIGLGTMGGQGTQTSATLITTGLVKVDENGNLINVTDVAEAIERFNKKTDLGNSIPADEIINITTMQQFIDYVYNTPKGYVAGDANYHVYDATKDYFAKSGIVVETAI